MNTLNTLESFAADKARTMNTPWATLTMAQRTRWCADMAGAYREELAATFGPERTEELTEYMDMFDVSLSEALADARDEDHANAMWAIHFAECANHLDGSCTWQD